VSNVLSEEQKQQVIALGRLGWSLRRIERETGVRRETISTYLKEAGVALRPPRGRQIPAKPASGATLGPGAKPASENQVSPDLGAKSADVTQPEARIDRKSSACDAHRELIELALLRGRNAKSIWQELVDAQGFAGHYQSVKRFVRKLRGKRSSEARVVIQTAPGEEAQVDYGDGPMVRDPHSGKYRRTRLFVLILGYSRKCIRLLTFTSSARIWAELHETAFRRLGGVSRLIVLDNLREGVLKPDIYDPTINPLYRDMLAHYGAVAMPCRVGDPDRKGKVEAGVAHAQKTPLKGQRFEKLEDAQVYLDRWEERWADTRIHGTTKRQVAVMFAEERPMLLPLPVEPFRYYQYGERVVHLDGCVEVEAAYYSAPPGWIGRRVHVQWDIQRVRLIDPRSGQLLREHLRLARGGHRIDDQDRPERTPLGTLQLLNRAQKASSNIGVFSQALYQQQGQPAVRRILGLLWLAKKYSLTAVDDACAAALEMGVCDYRFVRRYLERKPLVPIPLRQVDPLIRQLELYRDLIENRTQENPE
jgi:transposase